MPSSATPTIQAGIDAASNGDTVLVAPGTYFENIDFKGKAITVTSSAGAASTIIDGGGNDATVVFYTAETRASVLSGFTIRNGAPGIAIGSSPTISDNIVANNHCSGIDVEFATPLIQNNTVTNTSNAPIGTTSQYCSNGGVGINLGGSAYNTGFAGTSVVGNIIENSGGGGIVNDASESAVIQNNIIRNNMESGGIEAFNIQAIMILQNLVYGNAGDSGMVERSGGISIMPFGDTVGPFFGIIAGNTIAGNTVLNGMSGETGEQLALSGNLAQYLLINNVIVGSSATIPAINCGVVYNYLTLTPTVFDHNDIYNPAGSAYGGACSSQTGSYGNVSADPLFTNVASGNYRPLAGSPAIDTGNNSAPLMPSLDFAGNSRILDATKLGYPVVDMGAYEFVDKSDATPSFLTLIPSQYFYPSPYGVSLNQTLSFTSTLTSAVGQPTGPVSIYVDDDLADTVTVDSSGSVTFSLPDLIPGLHAFTSTYSGSGIFPPAISVKFYLIVPASSSAATTTSLTSSLNPANIGQSVTFTATVTSANGTPTGAITFSDGATTLGTQTLVNGAATFSTSTLAIGNHTIAAAYTPTGNTFNGSKATLSQVINGTATATSLTITPTTAVYGTTIFMTSTVNLFDSPNHSGNITFMDGALTLAIGELGTDAVTVMYNDIYLAVGTHSITAVYSGDATHNSSTRPPSP